MPAPFILFLLFAFFVAVVLPELTAPPFRLPVLPTRRAGRALVWSGA